MPPDKPSPIEPLDYARPAPPKPRWMRMIPSRRTRRIIRLTYLILCAIGFIYVFRFLLHYRQILEDTMNQK